MFKKVWVKHLTETLLDDFLFNGLSSRKFDYTINNYITNNNIQINK